MNKNFIEWLERELNARDWSRATLSKKADINQSTLSLIFSGDRNPGADICVAIATGFKIPPEIVFRAAGILKPVPKLDETIEEIIYDLRQLPPHEVEDIKDTITAKLKRHERERNKGSARKT